MVGDSDASSQPPAHDPAPLPRQRWIPWQGADGQSPDGRRQARTFAVAARGLNRVPHTGSVPPDFDPVRARWHVPGAARRTRHADLDAIEVRDVTRRFTIAKQPLVALERVSFHVPEGQVVAVVGPNGSGKSTLLRLISGLLDPDEGSILIRGTRVRGPDPRVGLAFQEPRLLPWRTVLDNVAFPLELAGWERDRRERRAVELLERVGVVGFERAHPAQLSGGMSQRVGIARALALDPPVLLLDEPFSALDSLTRDRLNLELLGLWEATGSTVVLVTHNIPEAVFLADRVLVLSPRPGRIIADVTVDLARPREAQAVDTAAFSEAANRIREALAGDGTDGATPTTGAAPSMGGPRREVAA